MSFSQFQQIEEFFSKEVTAVITDTPESQFPGLTKTEKGAVFGPPSPWTPRTPGQSPATSTSTSTSILDSDRKRASIKPPSRAGAILARAKNSKVTSSNSTQVLETAYNLNIGIWSVLKTIEWVEKYRIKYGASKDKDKDKYSTPPRVSKVEKRVPKVEKKVLLPPSLKLESTNSDENTRPSYFELKAWPQIRYDGRPGCSPFSTSGSSGAKLSVKKLAKRLDVDREEHPSAVKSARKDSPSIATQKKKIKGFCEICNKNFSDLDQHLVTEKHREFITRQSNWTEVDQFCIDNFTPQ